MSKDVDLSADDFAAVLGGIQRVREAHLEMLRERTIILEYALGEGHETTQASLRMYAAALEREAA